MIEPWDALKLLADPTRLRLLHLLTQAELSVAELQDILGMGQSRISSHLGLLRQGEILVDRKDGKKNFYSPNPQLAPPIAALVHAACESVSHQPLIADDRNTLQRILEKRRRASELYFNTIADRLGKNYCPGRSWEAIGHTLLHLTPPLRIADLGAGEGLMAQLLARQAEWVYCIDSSPRMVEVGTELAQKNNLSNLEYLLGDIEDVPLAGASVHIALLSLALHHAPRPQKAIDEAHRILKPQGKILLLELKEHTFEKAHELYADHWLGFSENTLYKFLRQAGFQQIDINTVAREPQEPYFETLLATATKP